MPPLNFIKPILMALSLFAVGLWSFFFGKNSEKLKQSKSDLDNVRNLQKRQAERDSNPISLVRERMRQFIRKK